VLHVICVQDDSVLDDTTDLIAAEDTDTEPTVATELYVVYCVLMQ